MLCNSCGTLAENIRLCSHGENILMYTLLNMSMQENGLERLEAINMLLPPKCRGCLTGIAEIYYLAGLTNVLGSDEPEKAIAEIEDQCEGYSGPTVDLRDFIDEDGRSNIPFYLLLENPNCPTAQRSKAYCDEQLDRMTR